MAELLDESQSCIVGKQIADPIQLVQTTIHHAKVNNHKAALMFLDFEKAFDSVSHSYTKELMHHMNISDKDEDGKYDGFIRWAGLAFTDTRASCIINGKLSKGFGLPGGGRQGDNLYPLLFALVVHGLKVLIDASDIEGYEYSPGKNVKIKQYADDTALFLGSDTKQQITKYLDIINTFCTASSMKINEGKTDLMFIGRWAETPPPPWIMPNPMPINVLKPGEIIRYLGVMIGTDVPKNMAWIRIKTKVLDCIDSITASARNTLTERILYTNAVVLGQLTYPASHSSIDKTALTVIDKSVTRSANAGNTLIPKAVLIAKPDHGLPVPLVNPMRMFQCLQTKSLYDLLTDHNRTHDHTRYMWAQSLKLIAHQAGALSFFHLMQTQPDLSKYRDDKRSKIQRECRTSVTSLFNMQLLYRNPLGCCEHAAFMPLFNNPLIIDPYTNAPFTTAQFNDLGKKLVYVGELFTSVCRYRYYRTAEIPPIAYTEQIFKDRRQIEQKYRHQLTPYQYARLTLSVPLHIKRLIMEGNLTLCVNSIYLNRHSKTYYITDAQDCTNLTELTPRECGLARTLNTLTMGSAQSPPRYKLTLTTTHKCNCNKHCTHYTIPAIIGLSLSDSTIENNMPQVPITYIRSPSITDYPDIAAHYRTHDSVIAPTLNAVRPLTDENDLYWKKIMKATAKAQTCNKTVDMLIKIMHKALYMGSIAHDYQVNIKHMDKYAPQLITPLECVHHPGVESSYQHEFFQCGQIIPRMWVFVNTLIDRLQLPHKLNAISGLHDFIHNTDCSTPSIPCIMNQNLVINALKAVWNAYQTKHEKNAAEYEQDIVIRFNTLMHIEFRMFRMHKFNEDKYGKHCEGDQDKQNYSARQRSMMHPPPPLTQEMNKERINGVGSHLLGVYPLFI